MKICMVTPAPPRSVTGNRVTALRWARLLGELGHRVTVREEYDGQACDLMVALHARKSARSDRAAGRGSGRGRRSSSPSPAPTSTATSGAAR